MNELICSSMLIGGTSYSSNEKIALEIILCNHPPIILHEKRHAWEMEKRSDCLRYDEK